MKEKEKEQPQYKQDGIFICQVTKTEINQADRVSLMTKFYSLTNFKDNVHEHPPYSTYGRKQSCH